MAAGIGSRFGGGIKQLEPVDSSNHIIMDYSIHDAIEVGFNHVVFIIRKDIEREFKEVIGERIADICKKYNVTVDYAFSGYQRYSRNFASWTDETLGNRTGCFGSEEAAEYSVCCNQCR